jgi:hypothetical protein
MILPILSTDVFEHKNHQNDGIESDDDEDIEQRVILEERNGF